MENILEVKKLSKKYDGFEFKNINIELLPEEIKNCKEYLIGYKKGLEGKHKAK